MDLIKLESKLPLKAYPESDLKKFMETHFKFWLSNLLSIKAENEDKVDFALPIIKKKFHSLGLDEVKKAFEMYALGELSIQPRSNYFDLVLVGQIFNAYKNLKRVSDRKETQSFLHGSETKADQDYLYCITAYDHFVQHSKLPNTSVWLYEYLEDYKKCLKTTKRDKITRYNIAFTQLKNKHDAILESKIKLVEHFFTKIHAEGKHIKNFI